MGAVFLKKFLRGCLEGVSPAPVDLIKLALAEHSEVLIKREWAKIDVLVVDRTEKIVVVIENKIDADEGDGQLADYIDRVSRQYPDYKPIFVYLTPDGTEPSLDQYIPVDYSVAISTLEATLNSPGISVSTEVDTLIQHYLSILKDQIVTDSKIKDLCEKIYKQHKAAIDLIVEHRPDRISDASDHFAKLVEGHADLELDKTYRHAVKFGVSAWDKDTRIKKQKEPYWSNSERTLLFQIVSSEKTGTAVKLSIGPGDENFRKKLFEGSSKNKATFNGGKKKLTGQTQICSYPIVSAEDLDGDYETSIESGWKQFVDQDLPKILSGIETIVAQPCPFYSSCTLQLRRNYPEVCKHSPWGIYEISHENTCWYGAAVAGTLGTVKAPPSLPNVKNHEE